MTIKDEWHQADSDIHDEMERRPTISIVPECGHSVAGHWGDKDSENKGAVCWNFEHGSYPIEVPWPDTLVCRHCSKVFKREDIQKTYLQPTYYAQKEGTFNCGCSYIDTSD